MRKFQLLLIAIVLCFAQCKKYRLDNDELPQATQEGRNTLGFLVNGEPFKPKGNNGTANLSIDFDPRIDNGIFSIYAYRINTSTNYQTFGLGLKDSLNFISVPKTYILGNESLFGVSYSDSTCTYDYFSNSINRSGSLTITKLDRINGIISGTFSATLQKSGCNEIKITNGRFDMKF